VAEEVAPEAPATPVAAAADEQDLRREPDDERLVDASGDAVMRVGPGAAASSTEVHCGAAQSRTKDEEDELAAWSVGETYDEITGAVLPPDLVRQARAEEIKFILNWGV
jgi:hypothetical protein